MPTSAEQMSQLYSLAGQADVSDQTVDQTASRGSLTFGNTSAETSMGSGGGGGGDSGGGGGGGGAGGYSLGASIAEGPITTTSGLYGDTSFAGSSGDVNFNFGGGSIATTGGSKVLIYALIAAAALGAMFLMRRR